MAKISGSGKAPAHIKAPSVKAKAGGGIPGSSSRARVNEAAGQKTTTPKGAVIATPKMQGQPHIQGADVVKPVVAPTPSPTAAASASSPMVMPSKHPAATTKAKHASGYPDL